MTGILTTLQTERKHSDPQFLLMGALIGLCITVCIVFFSFVFVWAVQGVQPTFTPTQLPSIMPTRTPIPTSTPVPTRTPTSVPLELFRGIAYVWPAKAPGFDNNFSVPGKPTGVKAWVCWTGTAQRGKEKYEIIVELQPRCVLGVNSVYFPAYNGIGISTDVMEKMGFDVLKFNWPRIAVFAWPGGLPPMWEVVDN